MDSIEITDRLLAKDLSVERNIQMLLDALECLKEDGHAMKLKEAGFIARDSIQKLLRRHPTQRAIDFYWHSILLLAPYDFDSYMLYMEKDRLSESRFYKPRRRLLRKHGAVQLFQDLEDDVLDIGGISMVPGAGKTTLEGFAASWVLGKYPEEYSIFVSHTTNIDKMFYDSVLNLTTDPEYNWGEIFPGVKLESTNAKDYLINFGGFKPFKSLSCIALGQNIAGRVRASKYMFCDDLVSRMEEAVNNARLEKLWQMYTGDLLQRKIEGCKEVHVATRWSVNDPLGKVQRANEGNPRARFIAIPDIDAETGESNFDYEDGKGFSVAYFTKVAEQMDEISY